MNIANRLILVVVSFIIFAFGGVTFLLVSGALAPSNQSLQNILTLYNAFLALVNGAAGNAATYIALALTLVGLALLVLEVWAPIKRLFGRREGSRYLVREDTLGRVTVDPSMVHDWIQHEAQAVPGVVHADPQVTSEKNGLHVATRASLAWDADAPAVGHLLQERIQESVQTRLGLPVAEVRVSVQSAPIAKEPPRRRVA